MSLTDPLADTPWSAPNTVSGFVQGAPNATLLHFADAERHRAGAGIVVDIGCGAGRNAVPLAEQGWSVIGIDLSWAMLVAAAERARRANVDRRLMLALSPMTTIPVRDRCADVVVAHGIWNLARSSREFRGAVREAARVAKPGAALFVFTFSRHTLADDASPVEGESFVFNQFSGDPQVFLTDAQLLDELAAAGFVSDHVVPLTEHNRRPANALPSAGVGPVIYEAAFRFRT